MASGSCPPAGTLVPGQSGSLIVSSDLYGVAATSAASVWAVGSTVMADPMAMTRNFLIPPHGDREGFFYDEGFACA